MNLALKALKKTVVCLVACLGLLSAASAATFTVSSTSDAGAGSLREAITQSNAAAGGNTINFSVTGTITLASQLPAITQPVTITGGNQAAPVVTLDGSQAGNALGLQISASNCTVRGLAIVNFAAGGIRIDTGGNNTIAGNYIGLNADGTTAAGNFNRGVVLVGSTGNTIGGAAAADRNIISGNSGTGLSITAGSSATVRNNFIGTTANGAAAAANSQDGIRIVDSSNSQIVGNTISGNNQHGIFIVQTLSTTTASGNTITGNLIGVNAANSAAVANNGSGIVIQASGNTIGGATVAARNTIAGNNANGVSISTNFAINNTVAGNFIGVAGATGATALGNQQNGVQISNNAANNVIGGADVTPGACNNSCNTIANNGGAIANSARAGIYVDSTAATGSAIRGNSVFANTGIGVDLGGVGRTANDAGDPDSGPNNLQNFPVISRANTNGTITGTLDSVAGVTFTLDFYVSPATDSANTQGRLYIGSLSNVSPGNFSFASTVALTAGQYITATATANTASAAPSINLINAVNATAVGDTSEISAAVAVTPPTAAPAQVSGIVKSANGLYLNGATVTLTELETGATQTVVTNRKGRFAFADVATGATYRLTATLKGFDFSRANRTFAHNGDSNFVLIGTRPKGQ